MMRYREGYDIRKWSASSVRQRRRQRWTRWVLLLGMLCVATMAAVELLAPPVFPKFARQSV